MTSRNLASNKKAHFNFEIIKTLEAGIELKGTEVKSLAIGEGNIGDSYVIIKNNAGWLLNAHIPAYKFGNITNHDPLRTRKLLLNMNEILKWNYEQKKFNYTIVPLNIYWKNNKIKIQIALAKGKKLFDKREDSKIKSEKRDSREY